MDGMSLLDVLRGVMLDPAEQAAYNADPGAYLARYGYDDVDSADLSEAFGLVADTLPPDVAQAAWQASADHGDGSFGGVSPEFDSQVGVDAAPEPAPEPEAGPPAGGDGEPEPALSFGYGEDDFTDAGTADLAAAEGGVGADEGEATESLDDGWDDDAGPGLDDPLGGEDDGLGVDDLDGEDHGLGVDDLGGDGIDEFDDSGQLDGLDDGADSTDVGSF
jgi:hypothetical protein